MNFLSLLEIQWYALEIMKIKMQFKEALQWDQDEI